MAAIRVDRGTKFSLVVTVQQHLSDLRQCRDHLPLLQSRSHQNHRVEHMWPEINQRINYPVKRVLVEREASGEINMTDDLVKVCVSLTTITVITSAIDRISVKYF